MIGTGAVDIHPLTPDRAADFQALFGPQGACYGCWCTAFLLPPKQRHAMSGEARRDLMLERIAAGPPPGLLAYDAGGLAVGWMQIGPRASVPEWNNPRRSSTPLDDAPADDPGVWAITCFFFRNTARGKGLSHQILAEGLKFARSQGARLVEASPMDQAKQSKSIGLFVGSTRVFKAAGFVEVARAKPGRPLMRYDLGL